MMRTPRRQVRWAAGCVATLVVLSGCGLHDVRLPGGAGGGNTYRVSAEFADVLHLVPQAAVKVNNVSVGSVDAIERKDWHAVVRLRLDRAVRLASNAVASLGQTSLLGEKYVQLSAPAAGGTGRLREGAVIPLS